MSARTRANEPLGTDEATGKNIYALIGPYGPYVQLGDNEDPEKPKRISLPKGKNLEDVDLEFAKKLLSLPREIGYDPETGKKVSASIGRFGPYVTSNGKFKSVKNVEDLFTIGVDEAVELLKQARSKPVLKELGKHPETDENLQILKGRFGPYVTDGKTNVSLPKGTDPESVTLEQAVEMLKTAPAKGKAGKTRTKNQQPGQPPQRVHNQIQNLDTLPDEIQCGGNSRGSGGGTKPAVRKRFIKRPATK